MEPLRITYKQVDGVEIPADVYLPDPANVRRELAPVLFMIHGGAWIVGHAGMVSKDQISDCLRRGWIVLSLEHRLCPGVTLIDGPIRDVRDALAWVHSGGLGRALEGLQANVKPDNERVLTMGLSSGGHLSLCLAFDVPKSPIAILDFYGTKHLDSSWWSKHEALQQPDEYAPLFKERCTFLGGVSLEGQSKAGAQNETAQLRQAFVQDTIRKRNLLQVAVPDCNLRAVDPYMNVHKEWPPTCIVHGNEDGMFPIELSRDLEAKFRDYGVDVLFIEVEGEGHTFVPKMKVGSQTWNTQLKGFEFLEEKLEESYRK